MNPPRILIVDDEESIRFILERTLRNEGYILETAVHGGEAIQKITQNHYDLILLDLHMEPVGGMDVFNAARTQDPDMMVIILTAHGSLDSSVEALRLGAFDYLFKPADPKTIRQRVQESLEKRRKELQRQQLIAQIDSLRHILNDLNDSDLSHSPPAAPDRFIRSGQLVIDSHHQVITFGEEILDLTTAEYNILCTLVKHEPNPISPRKLVNHGLGYDSEEHEAREIIKWHIHKLRRKIEPNPSRPQYIKTVRYKGYMWSSQFPE